MQEAEQRAQDLEALVAIQEPANEAMRRQIDTIKALLQEARDEIEERRLERLNEEVYNRALQKFVRALDALGF